jgi:phosphoserine phosphatase
MGIFSILIDKIVQRCNLIGVLIEEILVITNDGRIVIYLIRHGESTANKNSSIQIGGRSEHAELTDHGVLQAQKLGLHFARKKIPVDTIYSSTFIRAVQTANIFANNMGIPVSDILRRDELVEMDQGKWEGAFRNEVYTPEVLNLILSQQNYFIPPGGESKAKVIHRLSSWLLKEILVEENLNKNIAVVFHGLAIKCLLQHIMGFNDSIIYSINTENTSVSKLTFSARGWSVNYLNSTSHLD